jgi:flagellar protein FlaG
MNIKSVNYEPTSIVGKYARNTETVDAMSVGQHYKPTQDSPQHELSREEIADVVDRLNSGVRDMHERLNFSFHEKTQRVVVKIINTDTNEVIREIPAREAIKLLEHIQDFLGMIVDESR